MQVGNTVIQYPDGHVTVLEVDDIGIQTLAEKYADRLLFQPQLRQRPYQRLRDHIPAFHNAVHVKHLLRKPSWPAMANILPPLPSGQTGSRGRAIYLTALLMNSAAGATVQTFTPTAYTKQSALTRTRVATPPAKVTHGVHKAISTHKNTNPRHPPIHQATE